MAALFLLTARDASAQDADNPFADCKNAFFLQSVHPAQRDPITGERTMSGGVVVVCDGTQLFAEEVRWNDDTVKAKGNLLVVQEGLRVTADRMEMDRHTKLGTFYNAYGTARLTDEQPDKNLFGTLEPEVMFRADKIERIGPRRYRLTGGWFTTCVQPEPRWAMSGSSGTITLDDAVSLKNVMFKVKGVPVLYIPYLYYPLNKEDRKTGFLIPSYSYSEFRGHGVSAAFFWAINRSQDATIYYDAYSVAGQGGAVDYRYVAGPGDHGDMRLKTFWEQGVVALDGTVVRPPKSTWEFNGAINQSLGSRFRLIGNANYFTDQVSKQLYQQGTYDFTQNLRAVHLAVTGMAGPQSFPLRLEGIVRVEDNFSTLTSASRMARTPQVNVRLDQQSIRRFQNTSPVYYGGWMEVVHLDIRPQLDDPTRDQNHWRVHGETSVRAPMNRLGFMSVTPSATWRLTNWSESLDPITHLPVAQPLTRSMIDLRVDMIGPTLERKWRTPDNPKTAGFVHEIQPRVTVSWMSAFDDIARVIRVDPVIDSLQGGTTSVNYSLTNKFYRAIRRPNDMTSPTEIASVEIGQTYYGNAFASSADQQYLTQTVANFLPIFIRASVRPVDNVNGEFRMEIHPVAKAVMNYSANAFVRGEFLQLTAGWSKREVIPSVPELSNPANASHFLDAGSTVRLLNGKTSGGYGFAWDIRNNRVLQHRIIVSYIAQCCGFAFDYQIRNLSHLTSSGAPAVDRRWNFSLTLAGIGSFSNPFGSFRQ